MSTGDRVVSKGVVVNPDRCGGEPTIQGTRIHAAFVANVTEGSSPLDPFDLILDYESLTYQDISNARGWDRKGRPA